MSSPPTTRGVHQLDEGQVEAGVEFEGAGLPSVAAGGFGTDHSANDVSLPPNVKAGHKAGGNLELVK